MPNHEICNKISEIFICILAFAIYVMARSRHLEAKMKNFDMLAWNNGWGLDGIGMVVKDVYKWGFCSGCFRRLG